MTFDLKWPPPHDTRGPSSYPWSKFGPGRVKGWRDMAVTSNDLRSTTWSILNIDLSGSRWPLTSNDPPQWDSGGPVATHCPSLVQVGSRVCSYWTPSWDSWGGGPVATHCPSLVQVGSRVEEIWSWPLNDHGWPQVNSPINFEHWPPDDLWWLLTSNDPPHDTRGGGANCYTWSKYHEGRSWFSRYAINA